MFAKRLVAVAFMALVPVSCFKHSKPVPSDKLEKDARPQLEVYLKNTLVGQKIGSEVVSDLKLVDAHLFRDGFYHESWRLTTALNGSDKTFALKIYPDHNTAERSKNNFANARKFGWPVPMEIARGPVNPYLALPGLLMEYVEQPTLATYMRERWGGGQDVVVEDLAHRYQSVGEILGQLHRASSRARTPEDESGNEAMGELIYKCREFRWCGKQAMARFELMEPKLDAPDVAFVHGDIYEAHLVFDKEGKLTRLLGLHNSRFADPAWDVGTILAHMLLVNPSTRHPVYGVTNPKPSELKRTAEAFLMGYRQGAGLDNETSWKLFIERSKGYMWLRLGNLLANLRENPHAQSMINLVNAKKVALFVVDPLEKLKIRY